MTRSHWLLALVSTLGGIGVGQFVPLSRVPTHSTAATGPTSAGRSRQSKISAVNSNKANPASQSSAPVSAAQLESDFRRLWQAAKSGSKADFEKALKAAQRSADADGYRAMKVAMSSDGPKAGDLVAGLAAYMKGTAHLALRALLENPKWKSEWSVVDAIFENLAKLDPRLAWEEATKDGRTLGAPASSAIGKAWADKAPHEAVAFAQTIADQKLRRQLSDAIFVQWMHAKPDDFVIWLRALPDRREWDRVIPWQEMIAATEAEFLDLAAAVPEHLPQPRFDGESAFDGFFKKPEKEAEYLAWVKALPEGAKRDTALSSLAKAMLIWNPEGSLPLLSSVKDAAAQTQITSAVAACRASMLPTEGVAFADSLQGNARTLALRSAVSTWAEFDPAGAAAFIVTRPDDFGFVGTRTDQLRDQLDDVVRKWAKHEPQGAASFALAQKEAGVAAGVADQMNYGLRSAMSAWVDQDAYAASAWVMNMPQGRTRDIATDALAGAAMSVEPEGALGWAMSIGDAELRAQCIRDCVGSWSFRDARGAQGWVQSAAIDDAERAKLSALVQERSKFRSTSSIHDGQKTVFY